MNHVTPEQPIGAATAAIAYFDRKPFDYGALAPSAAVVHVARRWRIIIGLSLAFVANASAGEVTLERRLACTADAFKFCISAIPSIEAVKACMIANKAKLSAGCQAMFEKRR